MSRRAAFILFLLGLGLGAGGGVLGYTWFVGGSGAPSAPISAPTLSLQENEPDMVGTNVAGIAADVDRANAGIGQLGTEIAQISGRLDAIEAGAVIPATTEEAAPTQIPTPSLPPTVVTSDASRSLFRIVPAESAASFILHEELFGQPNEVVGTTSEVAGDIAVDFANPANSQVGTIVVNARTLATDNEFRNRAIRTQILESRLDEYEFIQFAPTALSDLPATIAMGEVVTFHIAGDLTIRNITKPVTFEVSVTPVSDTRLEGKGQATVMRGDFNLQIPSAPGVANVSEEVTLEINFVAERVEQ